MRMRDVISKENIHQLFPPVDGMRDYRVFIFQTRYRNDVDIEQIIW